VNAGFRREVDENCALLKCTFSFYAALSSQFTCTVIRFSKDFTAASTAVAPTWKKLSALHVKN